MFLLSTSTPPLSPFRMLLEPRSPDYKATMPDDHAQAPQYVRASTPDRVSRSSFSSIRENDCILAQTFSSSKISSYYTLDSSDDYSSADEAAVDLRSRSPSPDADVLQLKSRKRVRITDGHNNTQSDHQQQYQQQRQQQQQQQQQQNNPESTTQPYKGTMIQAQFQPPITNPHSKLLGYWTPAESFRGWKGIEVKGKLASKSFGDLQILHHVFSQPTPSQRAGAKGKEQNKGVNKPGQAPIERLPPEILTSIIELLALDVPPNGVTRRNVDLMSLLLTSKTLHYATLTTLYSKITIPHSRIFRKFLNHVAAHPTLGTIVRRLDFCHFNPGQLFLTAAERSQARNLTSETLLQCLELTPNLQEFLAQEYIDDDLSEAVLRKLFLGLPRIKALDFCGCTSAKFKNAFSAAITGPDWPVALTIRRLSFHKCLTLPSSVFEHILPRCPRLTHLDVAGTRVTDAALHSIPASARITHLNLAKCTLLSARAVIDFLAHHPAARELVFLSLATDARSHELFDAEHVSELLPLLPPTLKSLSLKGARMEKEHIRGLRRLSKHLEELAVGRGLTLSDVNRLFVPDEPASEGEAVQMQLDWVPHSLRYIDLSDFWGTELDLVYLVSSSECAILKSFSEPLEVVELAEDVFRRVSKSGVAHSLQRMGWRLSEVGSRGWIVRDTKGKKRDDGRRRWKMGAESWGMRKIPVARAEVGGMYGSFMFGRKL